MRQGRHDLPKTPGNLLREKRMVSLHTKHLSQRNEAGTMLLQIIMLDFRHMNHKTHTLSLGVSRLDV